MEIEFNLAMGLLKNEDNQIDVLGHPFGVYLRFFDSFKEKYFEELFIESLKRGIAIEINAKYMPHDKKKLFELLKKVNPYISIGSDAHNTEEILISQEMLKQIKNS